MEGPALMIKFWSCDTLLFLIVFAEFYSDNVKLMQNKHHKKDFSSSLSLFLIKSAASWTGISVGGNL